MHPSLPSTTADLLQSSWSTFEPLAVELAHRELNDRNLKSWLTDWSDLDRSMVELLYRLYVATTCNTADHEVTQRYQVFLDEVFPQAMAADQVLKEKLLASGLEPDGFDIPLRNMRSEADLFRQENLPLLAEEQKLNTEYDKIIGAQTVQWEGQEVTITQLRPVYQEVERNRREQAWRLAFDRQMADRGSINALWQKMLALRSKIAANAGRPDYRAYRWQQLLRFDYTPGYCRQFHQAIEEVVVPAALRIYERRRQHLGVEKLRPWDLDVDLFGRPPLRPFQDVQQLQATVSAIFHRVDPKLGTYFDTMIRNGLLDLENRKNKAPGGYCIDFPVLRKPFIFMNAVGIHDDVQTLLHEGGHAFHVFETAALPYYQQTQVPNEFAEVASMSMELLASPYLTSDQGGFYSQADAARVIADNLEGIVLFWPYMAVVDAFQHWVYENPYQASEPSACDATWANLWACFMPGVDWSGLDEEMRAGWQRKLHIHTSPFYYIEYGLAQLGAVQVWHNALQDQAGAVASYRKALALGYTTTLAQLYQAAGARLAFDAGTLRQAVDLIEDQLARFAKVI